MLAFSTGPHPGPLPEYREREKVSAATILNSYKHLDPRTGRAAMQWFSKKKFPPIESLPAEDQWSLGQGQHDGKPMFVRINSSAKEYIGHPDLPFRLGIAVPLHEPRPDGLPDQTETQQLIEIEDRLFEAIGIEGRVVLIITTSGMREFVSYVRTGEGAQKIAQSLQTAVTTHDLQHYIEQDRKWSLYQQFE
jgi:hypothetical protein